MWNENNNFSSKFTLCFTKNVIKSSITWWYCRIFLPVQLFSKADVMWHSLLNVIDTIVELIVAISYGYKCKMSRSSVVAVVSNHSDNLDSKRSFLVCTFQLAILNEGLPYIHFNLLRHKLIFTQKNPFILLIIKFVEYAKLRCVKMVIWMNFFFSSKLTQALRDI